MRNIISLIRLFTTASLAVVLSKVLSWLIAPVGSFLDTWVSDNVTVLSGIFAVIFTIAVEVIRENRLNMAKKAKPEIDVKFVEALEQRIKSLINENHFLMQENKTISVRLSQMNKEYDQLLSEHQALKDAHSEILILYNKATEDLKARLAN